MKKNKVYIFVLLALFGWSCADKEELIPDAPKYEVAFAVSATPGSLTKASSIANPQTYATDPIFDEVAYITLLIYNSKGYLVSELNRWSDMSTDVFVSLMEEGTYTAIAIGNNGDEVSGVERLASAQLNKYYGGQVFLDKTEFKVGPSEKSEVTLMLKRKVGVLDIDITDQPTNQSYLVTATIQNMPITYALHDFIPAGSRTLTLGFHPYTSSTDFPYYFFLPNNSSSYKTSILLEVYDATGAINKSFVLKDVTLGVNMKTTIRGKLYDPQDHHFTIEVGEDWTEDILDF